jgi:hypothetical protein
MGRGALGRENPAMNCRATFDHSYGMAGEHHFAKVKLRLRRKLPNACTLSETSAKVAESWHPSGVRTFFLLGPVVSLADSLYHRLRLLQASGLLKPESEFRRGLFQGAVFGSVGLLASTTG